MWLRRSYYNKVWGTDLDPTCEFSISAKFDLTHPKGLHIFAYTQIAFEARILCHDRARGIYRHTRIGANCRAAWSSSITLTASTTTTATAP